MDLKFVVGVNYERFLLVLILYELIWHLILDKLLRVGNAVGNARMPAEFSRQLGTTPTCLLAGLPSPSSFKMLQAVVSLPVGDADNMPSLGLSSSILDFMERHLSTHNFLQQPKLPTLALSQ